MHQQRIGLKSRLNDRKNIYIGETVIKSIREALLNPRKESTKM